MTNTHFENAATSLANGGKLAVTLENEAIIYTMGDLTEATLAVAYEARTANLLAYLAQLREAERESFGIGRIERANEISVQMRTVDGEISTRLDHEERRW